MKALHWLRRRSLTIAATLAFAYIFAPIVYIFAFSFNDSRKSNIVWQGFTLKNWANPCGAPQVCPAVANSLRIGLLATTIATVLGTMVAFALARHRFRGRAATNVLVFLPMATPEVVMGASLAALFLNWRWEFGTTTIVIAHVMFCLSFVVVSVKARILSLDPGLEQAAMDLYANEYQTFRRITLPLVAPGIAGAALLSFSLSFDDFIITNFTSGDVTTFPKFVYVSAQRGIPAQAYVVASAMFALAMAVAILTQIPRLRRERSR